jgi:hypothetical protein
MASSENFLGLHKQEPARMKIPYGFVRAGKFYFSNGTGWVVLLGFGAGGSFGFRKLIPRNSTSRAQVIFDP